MAAQTFQNIAAKNRAAWSSSAKDRAALLSAHLETELSAKEVLGRQLAEARKAAHLTQPQLAEQTGLQQADISRIENGLGNPTRDTLIKLAEALDMQIVLQPKESHTPAQS